MSSNNIHKVRKLFANSVLIPEVIKMLEEGHSVTLPLRGFSMRPFLEDERDMACIGLLQFRMMMSHYVVMVI